MCSMQCMKCMYCLYVLHAMYACNARPSCIVCLYCTCSVYMRLMWCKRNLCDSCDIRLTLPSLCSVLGNVLIHLPHQPLTWSPEAPGAAHSVHQPPNLLERIKLSSPAEVAATKHSSQGQCQIVPDLMACRCVRHLCAGRGCEIHGIWRSLQFDLVSPCATHYNQNPRHRMLRLWFGHQAPLYTFKFPTSVAVLGSFEPCGPPHIGPASALDAKGQFSKDLRRTQVKMNNMRHAKFIRP